MAKTRHSTGIPYCLNYYFSLFLIFISILYMYVCVYIYVCHWVLMKPFPPVLYVLFFLRKYALREHDLLYTRSLFQNWLCIFSSNGVVYPKSVSSCLFWSSYIHKSCGLPAQISSSGYFWPLVLTPSAQHDPSAKDLQTCKWDKLICVSVFQS